MRHIYLALILLGSLTSNASSQVSDPQPDENGIYYQRGGIIAPQLIHATQADYPSGLPAAGMKHICVVSAIIGIDGIPSAVQLENTRPSPFDAAAIEAVKRSTFSPGTLHNRAIPVLAQVWVKFRGDGKPAIPATQSGKFDKLPAPHNSKPVFWEAHGTVVVGLLLTEDGRPTDLHILQHLGRDADEKAMNSVSEYRFTPAVLDGETVPLRISIGVESMKH